MNRVVVTALLVIGLLLPAAHARADGDKAAAEALFTEAKRLMADGRYDDACPKLAESQRLDAGGGTLLNLALCHEKQGKTATAWSEFREALAVAKRDQREDRIAFAEQHIAQLQPTLSQLKIEVAQDPTPSELVVEVDQGELKRPSWGIWLPIDPGEHQIVARALGYITWETRIRVAPSSDQQAVRIPTLEPDPQAQRAAVAPPPVSTPRSSDSSPAPETGPSGQRIAGIIVGGLGVVGVAIGIGFGVDAINQDAEADELCPDQETCPPTADGRRAVELSGDAQTSANLATGFIGAGAALVAAGLIVMLTASDAAPAGDASSARVFPLLGPGQAGFGAQLKW